MGRPLPYGSGPPTATGVRVVQSCFIFLMGQEERNGYQLVFGGLAGDDIEGKGYRYDPRTES